MEHGILRVCETRKQEIAADRARILLAINAPVPTGAAASREQANRSAVCGVA